MNLNLKIKKSWKAYLYMYLYCVFPYTPIQNVAGLSITDECINIIQLMYENSELFFSLFNI